MNCQEALSLLYDIIDKEASDIDAKEVEEHIEVCRNCSDIFRIETSIHEFLKLKLQSNQPTTKLEALKKRVLYNLDEIDCNEVE
ncbi:MAG: hypothetical protein DRP47_07700 [Candidatus Zixiibacteriota bacterium]|nr:MAG: hypothetical protein DRP47_07700 [candidate division Zixibacteria bacterium]